MTKEEAIHILDNLKPTNTKSSFDAYVVGKAITMAIHALGQEPTYYPPCIDCHKKMDEIRRAHDKLKEQEPCEDTISRQAVLEIQAKYAEYIGATKFWQMRDDIKALPSVTPQPKTGHWIIIDDCENFLAKCSECGWIEDSRMINKYPYCRCGAKMESEE